MRVYPGKQMKKKDGSRSALFVLPSGAVYERFDGATRRVGVMDGKGEVSVKRKYFAKFRDRVELMHKGEF